MTDIDLINIFFARTDLDPHETRLAQKAALTNQKLTQLGQEIQDSRKELMQKEDDIKQVNGQWDILLQLVLETERARIAERAQNVSMQEQEQEQV